MDIPNEFARFVLTESDDPAQVADMATLLVSRFTSGTATLDATPRVSPPTAWVRAKQKGPVALAAWAAEHCDDADTLRGLYATPKLRVRVREALERSTHLPPDLRRTILAERLDEGRDEHDLLAASSSQVLLDECLASDSRTVGLPAQGQTLLFRASNDRGDHPAMTAAQVLTLCRYLLSRGHTSELITLLGSERPVVGDATRAILDLVFTSFDWGFLDSPNLDGSAARARGLLPAAPESASRPPVPPGLADGLVARDLQLTDREFAAVTASRLAANRGAAGVLGSVSSREQLAIALDLMTPDVEPAGCDVHRVCYVLDGAHDPLLPRVLDHLNWWFLSDFVQGSWLATPAEEPKPDKAQVRLLATMAHLDQIFTTHPAAEENRSRLLYSAAYALRQPHLPEDYRRLLVDAVPGLAIEALDRPDVRRWVWERLHATTRHLDRALDQWAHRPELPLRDLCTVLENLERISPKARPTPTPTTGPTRAALAR